MGLTRLAENMMGVPICQQVVLLNDGRAAESCGMLPGGWDVGYLCEPTPPAPPVLLLVKGPVGLAENAFLSCLLKEEARN